ncbi:hypothetical protein [Leifsonia shinshuensis]|uniref:Uncharacterized protein n=1 Tax=Leifsonia shinshuensis TaxID=150026 RepID=A0A7G6YCV3_9MICO|nr:hypothetical protein [Leifsonia shinshuensis]QNE36318.1 hypothetical protein F1C12_15155 [Leifsonia shinshuensis]
MDLRDVAADLYGVDPAEFVAARSAAAAGADRDLRTSITALRKPTASAAAVNALTRRDPELVDRILDLGDRMRDAFAARDRDAIRDLTRERQRLLQRALRDLGTSAAVGREVEETLQAAVVDPVAAAAVRSGMLVRALESTGVESVDVSEAVALPLDEEELAALAQRNAEPVAAAAPAKSRKTAKPRETAPPEHAPEQERSESASERRERERTVRAAERALERARADAEALDDELDTEVERRSDLEAERDTLERRLQRTEAELAESKAAERALRRRIPELQHAVRDAERALDDARGD